MRKFENVDIVAALGAVVELNTEHYKSDFKYDIAQFKAAARNPDGENNHLLWLSRKSGTHCYPERDVYIKDTSAFNTWTDHATFLGQPGIYQSVIVNDHILAFAVEITGIENGRIKGNLHELDFRDHVKQVNDIAIPKHTVTSIHKDGTKITLPHTEHNGKWQQLYHQHGQAVSYRADPQDKAALQAIVTQAREQRENIKMHGLISRLENTYTRRGAADCYFNMTLTAPLLFFCSFAPIDSEPALLVLLK